MTVVIKLRELMPQDVRRIVKNGQRVNLQRIAQRKKVSSNAVSGLILVFINSLIIVTA